MSEDDTQTPATQAPATQARDGQVPGKQTPGWLRFVVDYTGPLLFLAVVVFTHDLVTATWALVAGSAVGLATGFAFERKVAPIPLITGLAALVFGTLTLVFHNAVFIKIKPTVINLGFAAVLLGGLWRGKSPLKALMGEALKLTDDGWRKLTVRYAIFFLLLAGLNEVVWRTLPETTWATFKVIGMPLMAVAFSLSQVPMMLKDAKALELALKAGETQD